MIMEPAPTPQVVGLEFVRQYYTVLNKAPSHLHRFYNQESSFVHGGPDTTAREEKAVYGQLKIHEKILELDFRDCHAKIRQVDSHATLGDGVVIQVSGELSNKGEPMRRFMQTFVLAPQSPKKYYVHNDIFRYQDEVFVDDEGGDEGAMEEEDEGMMAEPVPHPGPVVNPMPTMNGSVPMMEEAIVVPTVAPVVQLPPVPLQPAVHVNSHEVPPAVVPVYPQESAVLPPGMPIPIAEPAPAPAPAVFVKEEVPMDNTELVRTKNVVAGAGPELREEEIKQEDEAMPNASEEKENKAVIEQSPEPPKNEKKTFSQILAENASQGSTAAAPPPRPAAPPMTTEAKEIMTNHGGTSAAPIGGIPATNGASREGRYGGKPPSRTSYPPASSGGRGGGAPLRERTRFNNEDSSRPIDDRRRPNLPFPDEQQIFVGNLAKTTTEEDLKECFSSYGQVIDARILAPASKSGPERPYPYYGFVVFDSHETVMSLLNKAALNPITYNGHRVNVEEKKAKEKTYSSRSSSYGEGGGRGDYSGRYSDGGPRGGRGGRGGGSGERGRGTGRGSYRGVGNQARASSSAAGTSSGGGSYRR